jgi:hypothetical protein
MRHLGAGVVATIAGAASPLRGFLEAILRSVRDLLDRAPEAGLDLYLKQLSTQIFANSFKPLVAHPSMTVDEYVALFTGDHLRWEAVGNIFAVAGRSLTATPANDTLFSGNRLPARSTLVCQMAEASDRCLSFCDQVSSANELLVALQVNDVMLKTQQYGDSSMILALYRSLDAGVSEE